MAAVEILEDFGGEIMKIHVSLVIMVSLMLIGSVGGYPSENYGPPEPPYEDLDTVPMNPINLTSDQPVSFNVPSERRLYLEFHLNGSSGNGKFLLFMYQNENETIPLHPDLQKYNVLLDEGSDFEEQISDNMTITKRVASQYRNDSWFRVNIVELSPSENISGIIFSEFYDSLGFRTVPQHPIPKENESVALLAIYYIGEGVGTINFLHYHLSWALIVRGGGAVSSSTTPLPVVIDSFFVALIVVYSIVKKKRVKESY